MEMETFPREQQEDAAPFLEETTAAGPSPSFSATSRKRIISALFVLCAVGFLLSSYGSPEVNEDLSWTSRQFNAVIVDVPIPDHYLLREERPDCMQNWDDVAKSSSRCGGCWADAFTTQLADRYCVKTTTPIRLASYFSLTCTLDKGVDGCQGCNAGKCDRIAAGGVPTGGIIAGSTSEGGCMREHLPYCKPPALEPDCPEGGKMFKRTLDDCPHLPNKTYLDPMCDNGEPVVQRIGRGSDCFIIPSEPTARYVERMKLQIMNGGTITVEYRSGTVFEALRKEKNPKVFDKVERKGGPTNHFLNIIGWSNKIDGKRVKPHWIVKSNWGSEWGNDGTARVVMGENLNLIETKATYIVVKGEGDREPIMVHLYTFYNDFEEGGTHCWSEDLQPACPKGTKATYSRYEHIKFGCYAQGSYKVARLQANPYIEDLPDFPYWLTELTALPQLCK